MSEDFLHLADLLLNFAGHLFTFTFGFQVGIACHFPHLLLHRPLHFVNLTCHLILATLLHGVPFVAGRHSKRPCYAAWVGASAAALPLRLLGVPRWSPIS